MNFIQPILSFIQGLSKNQILMILCAVSIVFGAFQYIKKTDYKNMYKAAESNIKVLSDSVTTYKNKAGDLTYEKSILQSDKESLKDLNKELFEDLEKEKGQVSYLQNLLSNIDPDTVYIDTTTVDKSPDGKYTLSWEYETKGEKWYKFLEGYTSFYWDSSSSLPVDVQTVIEKDILQMELITGIKEKDDRPHIFARSTYPGLEFTKINGAILDKDWFITSPEKPKRFGIGIHTGYGIMINDVIISGPYIGAGVSYNFIQF